MIAGLVTAASVAAHQSALEERDDHALDALELAGQQARCAATEQAEAQALAAAREAADKEHRTAVWETLAALAGGDRSMNYGRYVYVPGQHDIQSTNVPGASERVTWAASELQRLADARREIARQCLERQPHDELHLRRGIAALKRLAKRYAQPKDGGQ